MHRNTFTKFILSIFLAQGVITSSSLAAFFNSDYQCSDDYQCSGDYSCSDDCHWSGWYIGEYIGNALGRSKFKTSVDNGTYFTNPANIVSVNQSGSKSLSPHNFKGQTLWGIQAGYNCARKNYIYGLATDVGFFNLSGSREVTDNYPTFDAFYTIKTEINTSWLWTTRGRLGIQLCTCWPFIYGTGGFALASIRVSNEFFDTAGSHGVGSSSNKSVKLGWVAGGGIEFPLCQKFTVNGEYLFTKFNYTSTKATIEGEPPFGTGLVSPFKTKANLSAHVIRVGINYKF